MPWLPPHLQDPTPEACFRSRKRTAIDRGLIFHLLEEATGTTEDPPLSLQEVGQRLGYQPTTLYKINRVACHAIAERFTTYRGLLREKRLQGYREEIRQIALLLQAEKIALTRRHIARYLSQPAILHDPHVRILLTEVYCEVEEKREVSHGKETGAFGERETHRQAGCEAIRLDAYDKHETLVAWYQHLGYHSTGAFSFRTKTYGETGMVCLEKMKEQFRFL
jgi:hypothetical protein